MTLILKPRLPSFTPPDIGARRDKHLNGLFERDTAKRYDNSKFFAASDATKANANLKQRTITAASTNKSSRPEQQSDISGKASESKVLNFDSTQTIIMPLILESKLPSLTPPDIGPRDIGAKMRNTSLAEIFAKDTAKRYDNSKFFAASDAAKANANLKQRTITAVSTNESSETQKTHKIGLLQLIGQFFIAGLASVKAALIDAKDLFGSIIFAIIGSAFFLC